MRNLILAALLLTLTLVPLASADVHVYHCGSGGRECYEAQTLPAPVDCNVYFLSMGGTRAPHCDLQGILDP